MSGFAVKVITDVSITVGTVLLAILVARAIYFHCEHSSSPKRTEGKEER
jgi:hypothetical protein